MGQAEGIWRLIKTNNWSRGAQVQPPLIFFFFNSVLQIMLRTSCLFHCYSKSVEPVNWLNRELVMRSVQLYSKIRVATGRGGLSYSRIPTGNFCPMAWSKTRREIYIYLHPDPNGVGYTRPDLIQKSNFFKICINIYTNH